MATSGNEESAISPNEPRHDHLNARGGLAVAASQHDPSKPHSNGSCPTLADHEEPQNYHEVNESGRPKSQHAWPQSLQNIGMHSATPLNNFATKMGSESFMPVTMDKDCKKAAKILRGFCKDGIYHDPGHNPSTVLAEPHEPGAAPSPYPSTRTSPKPKRHILLTIPSKVLSRAVGLAVFTTARAGFQISSAAGSGVLIARLPDGSWSPPSGIQVHTLGAGFLLDVDIYDCVCVINTREALETFMKTRLSLGPGLSVTAGPFGVGGYMDFAAPIRHHDAAAPEQHRDHVQNAKPEKVPVDDSKALREALDKPVYSYVNSRGFYAGIEIDGTVITERKDANAAFYGESISIEKILRGEVPAQGPAGMWPVGARLLLEVLKGAVAWHGSHVAGELDHQSGVSQMNTQDRKHGPRLVATAHEE